MDTPILRQPVPLHQPSVEDFLPVALLCNIPPSSPDDYFRDYEPKPAAHQPLNAAAGAGTGPGFIYKLIKEPNLVSRRGFTGTVKAYKSDLVVERRVEARRARLGGGDRGCIKGFSPSSARRLLFTARNVQGLRTMVTLTYPGEFSTDGKVVKKHLKAILRWLRAKGLSGLWWLEFQSRGAPHFHIYLTGRVDKDDLSRKWYDIVGSGDIRHLRAGTNVQTIQKPHAVAAYAAKYARKQQQKDVPAAYEDVGRFWGLFGGLTVESLMEVGGVLSEEVGRVIRAVRSLYRVKRQALFARGKVRSPLVKDRGRNGFTCYDLGPPGLKLLERLMWA